MLFGMVAILNAEVWGRGMRRERVQRQMAKILLYQVRNVSLIPKAAF